MFREEGSVSASSARVGPPVAVRLISGVNTHEPVRHSPSSTGALDSEAQYLHGPSWSHAAVAEALDQTCDRIPANLVLVGTSDPAARSTDSESARSRPVPVRLVAVPPGAGWNRLVNDAEAALRLHAHQPGTLAALSGYLHQRTSGNIGRLAVLLRTAAVRAIREGTERLTAPLLSEQPLSGQANEA